MSGLRRTQRDLYLAQRTIGDVRAAQRGPQVLVKRLVRRQLTRSIFSIFGNGRRR